MKNKLIKLLVVFFLITIFSYVLAIETIPDNLVVFEGENISLKTLLGITIKDISNTLEASSNYGESITDEAGQKTLEISLFDSIMLKSVNVDVLEKVTVIPVGSMAGVKLYTTGVLVVGMSEIQGIDNKKHKPYENTGIEEGDTITEINDKPVFSTKELIQTVNQSNGEMINIKYVSKDEVKECSIEPIKTSDNEYKLGLWVRDSAAGVGTVTFYEPETKTFGALRTWNY